MNFLVVVGNNGTLDIEESITLEMWGIRSDGSQAILDIALLSGLGAGEQSEGIEFQLRLSPTDDFVDIMAKVDAAGLITECDETNNEAFWGGELCSSQ